MANDKAPSIEFSGSEDKPKSKAPPQVIQEPKVPHDFVTLPSRGLVYPRESPLHGAEQVEYRHMMAHDEDILMSPSMLRNGTAIDTLLRSCLVDKSIDPGEFISGDKNAIMIAIRASGYTNEYKIHNLNCSLCGETVPEYTFDLGKLEIKELGSAPVSEGENLFEFVLPQSGRTVLFKLLTSGEEKDLSKAQETMRKKMPNSPERNSTTRLKTQIVRVDDNDNKTAIAQFVDHQLSAQDSRALRKHIESVSPDVDMKQEFVCSACGEMSIYNIPITAEFFWPDARE